MGLNPDWLMTPQDSITHAVKDSKLVIINAYISGRGFLTYPLLLPDPEFLIYKGTNFLIYKNTFFDLLDIYEDFLLLLVLDIHHRIERNITVELIVMPKRLEHMTIRHHISRMFYEDYLGD